MSRRQTDHVAGRMTCGRASALVDLDGTLVDTNYLHTLAWSRAFSEMDAWAPLNAIHRLIGMGGDQLVPELLGHDLPGVHDAQARHFTALKPEVRAFPGAAPLLRGRHDLGLTVVLASSASGDDLNDLREVFDADDAIDAVAVYRDAQELCEHLLTSPVATLATAPPRGAAAAARSRSAG